MALYAGHFFLAAPAGFAMNFYAATLLFSHSALFGWTPLSRGSGGRFGLRRFRAKQNPTPFGTHRAFTRTLPPSQASVQFLSPFRLFLSAGAQVKDKNRPATAKRKKQ